jgi:Protein of unknown function (DUF1446).
MKSESVKILSPCGILGYGFPTASFERGLEMKPDAIVVDAGSTDAGPHKLGAGVAIVSRKACKKDLKRLICGSAKLDIPLIIGSAGGSGGKVHVDWTMGIIGEIIREEGLEAIRTCIIWADIPKDRIADNLKHGRVEPLGTSVPELTEKKLFESSGIVAQMGSEPIVKALNEGYQLIICGRAYDPSPFAAFAIYKGFSPALGYHMGKVLECGALCCDPGTTKDCMMGEIGPDYFDVYPTAESRRCTSVSVAAHTFYEKDHPYILHGPGIISDLSDCSFTQIDEKRVRVKGSRISFTDPYQIKLEGARKIAYRTFVVAGVRDPMLIGIIEEVEAKVKESVAEQYDDVSPSDYKINFLNYGINGIMGELEPKKSELPHEVCVVFEVIAKTQELASAICASTRSTFMHYGYEGRKSTSGNLAFPFAPSDVEFGAVYEFSVYHLMVADDPLEYFPIEEVTWQN